MSEHLLEPAVGEQSEHEQTAPRRRQESDQQLILSEFDPDAVIDHLEPPDVAIELITFGAVRETCPKCARTHLKLVLRQRRVRLAHLFCTECLSCFDAHYKNGKPALTI